MSSVKRLHGLVRLLSNFIPSPTTTFAPPNEPVLAHLLPVPLGSLQRKPPLEAFLVDKEMSPNKRAMSAACLGTFRSLSRAGRILEAPEFGGPSNLFGFSLSKNLQIREEVLITSVPEVPSEFWWSWTRLTCPSRTLKAFLGRVLSSLDTFQNRTWNQSSGMWNRRSKA